MSGKLPLGQDIYQLIVINHDRFIVPVHSIIRVLPLENILRLPQTADWLSGVVHIGNSIVPVINLNELINPGNPVIQPAYPLLVLLRHPLDSQRWLALCVTDLNGVLFNDDLIKMTSSTTIHPCLRIVLDNDSQKIHWLDISRIFEQLIEEKA